MISISDFTLWLTQFHIPIAIILVMIPLFSVLNGQLIYRKAKKTKAAALIYALLTYITVIPGICALITLAYLFFFTSVNLVREIDIIINLGPALSMIVTLTIIGRYMSFKIIPGFQRLSGLMLITGVSFILVLILYRMRVLIGFFAGAEVLLIIFILLFIFFKFGWEHLVGKRKK